MPPRPPTGPPTTRPPTSPTNSPTTSQKPGACACDVNTIKDPNCLNCANDPYGCLGCKACGVEDCRLSPSSRFFSGFVGSGNTSKSPVERCQYTSIQTQLPCTKRFPQLFLEIIFHKFHLCSSQSLLWQPTYPAPPMGTTCLCLLVPCHPPTGGKYQGIG